MNKSIFSILLLILIIPFMIFAAEKPQTMIEKSVEKNNGKSEQIDTYSLNKYINGYNIKLSTSTFNPSKATFLSEGFEGTFPPVGWTLVNTGVGFEHTSSRFHSGDSAAYHNYHFGQEDDWLVTPAVDLTGSVNARLTFYQNNNYSVDYVYHGIYVTTDTTGIMGDTAAWDLVYDGVALEGAWEQIIIDLSAYDGLTVYVGFYYSGDFADQWYIDDIVLEDAPVDPVMVTLYSELNAPPTAIGDTATTQTDEIGILVNNGGGDLNITSITIDNPDFSFTTTTSLVAPGDTLFGTASFQPSVSGLITGSMIITGDDPNNPSDTVFASGVGYPASYALEEFDNWVFTPVYFSRIDNNNDATEWGWFLLTAGGDSNFVAGMVYTVAGNDDYLVTPAFEVQSGDFISFDSWVYSASYPETWQVLVSTTDNLATSFTIGLDTVTSNSLVPVNYNYDLTAYAGNTIYIAIRNVSVNMYYQWVDNIIMPAPVGIAKLNEVYYDSPGGDTHTFTELFGTPGMNLDGFSLEGVNGNGGTTTDVIDLTGNSVPADGFFVIGQDAGVDNVDLIDSDVDFQNGPDNVVLINGIDTVDALGYGDFSSSVFVGEGNPAVDVFSGVSLSRFPDGDDTDDNATDFHGTHPTPGVNNYPAHPIIGGGTSVGFDSVMIGTDSTSNYTIYNNGSADLVVSNIVTSNADFTVDWSDSVIAVGGSAGLAVTFTPLANGTYTDSMTIYNNDPMNGARVVSLSGIGVGIPVEPPDDNNEYAFNSSPNGGVFRVDDNEALDVTGDFTVEAWVYINEDIGSSRFIADRDLVWQFYIISASVRFDLQNTADLITTGVLSLNEWHHVAVIREGTDTKIYADGEKKASSTILAMSAGTTPVVIGGQDGWFSGARTSIIDEVKFSNAAIYDTSGFTPLTTAPLGFDANTVFYFQFEDTTAIPPLDNGPLSLSISNGQTDLTNLFEAGNYVDAPAGLPLHPLPDPSILFADDFEAYTAGVQLTVQNSVDWTPWSGTPGVNDPYVSTTYANSGVNSINVITDDDLVKEMPNYTTGAYKISFNLYIPTGSVAYFNTLQEFAPVAQWGMNVYFRAGGVGDIDGGVQTATTFTYSYDTWLHNEVFVNLEKDTAEYYLDGVRIHGWKWTEGTGYLGIIGPLQLGGTNFYGGGITGGSFDYYVDDYELKEISPAIFADNFDSYTAGTQLVVQNSTDWTTWDGTAGGLEDPFVSNAYANSGANSVVIMPDNDLVKLLGSKTSGAYSMSWNIYIPTGKAGYFNAMSDYQNEWAMDVDFNTDGTAEIFDITGGPIVFSYTQDTWQHVELIVDLDQDLVEFYFEGTVIHQWQWTDGGANTLRLDALDFYGGTSDDEMYFDDFVFDTADPIVVGIDDKTEALPITFDLKQNYPNPFNPTTTIKYQLPKKADVKIVIYNMLGQVVRTVVDKSVDAGYQTVVWDGLNDSGARVATGIYIYRMETDKFVKAHKMIMMK